MGRRARRHERHSGRGRGGSGHSGVERDSRSPTEVLSRPPPPKGPGQVKAQALSYRAGSLSGQGAYPEERMNWSLGPRLRSWRARRHGRDPDVVRALWLPMPLSVQDRARELIQQGRVAAAINEIRSWTGYDRRDARCVVLDVLRDSTDRRVSPYPGSLLSMPGRRPPMIMPWPEADPDAVTAAPPPLPPIGLQDGEEHCWPMELGAVRFE